MSEEIRRDIRGQLVNALTGNPAEDLLRRISESSFGEHYALAIDAPITRELARVLLEYQIRQERTARERLAKKNEALRTINTHSATLATVLHYALFSPELATDLSKGYAEALEQMAPTPAFIDSPSGPESFEVISRADDDSLIELWGLIRRLKGLAVASGNMRSSGYGNPHGAPPKEQVALINDLKEILQKHNETRSEDAKIREDTEFAACICELLGLIGVELSRKTIRNTLSL